MQFPLTYTKIQSPPDYGFASARSGGVLFDHNSDHRRLRTTRKQWRQKGHESIFSGVKREKSPDTTGKSLILLFGMLRPQVQVLPLRCRCSLYHKAQLIHHACTLKIPVHHWSYNIIFSYSVHQSNNPGFALCVFQSLSCRSVSADR